MDLAFICFCNSQVDLQILILHLFLYSVSWTELLNIFSLMPPLQLLAPSTFILNNFSAYNTSSILPIIGYKKIDFWELSKFDHCKKSLYLIYYYFNVSKLAVLRYERKLRWHMQHQQTQRHPQRQRRCPCPRCGGVSIHECRRRWRLWHCVTMSLQCGSRATTLSQKLINTTTSSDKVTASSTRHPVLMRWSTVAY